MKSAWREHLESFSDYANRLPRGKTYVRNGSVCHLEILKGEIKAIVSGSSLYHVHIKIEPLGKIRWNRVKKACAGQIGSMLELLQGQLSSHVMEIVTDPKNGLFPRPGEITLACDCPDWAVMCKHLAATLYGVGVRLDEQPELLFLLRGVDHEELINTELEVITGTGSKSTHRRLDTQDLGSIFDIDLDEAPGPRRKKATVKKVSREKFPGKSASGKSSARTRPFTGTAASVKRLRKDFAITLAEFAGLVEVSQASRKLSTKKRR